MDSELDLLGERIAEQAAHFDAAMHRLLTDLRSFDERGGWHIQGASSCAHWLAWRVGWDLVTARERVRVASRLGGFPTIDDALRRGEISYSKVRAMMRVATPANELLLLEHARLMTASGLENLCRKYAMVQRHGREPRPQDDEQRRYVRRRDTEDGMVKIEAVLHPEEAELVWKMLDHAATQQLRESTSSSLARGLGCATDSAESRAPIQAASPPFTGTAHDIIYAYASSGSEEPAAPAVSMAEPFDSATADSMDESMGSMTSTQASAGVASGAGSNRSPDHTAAHRPSVLQQRADAAHRAFSRADALVSLAQGYLRGDRPDRAPIEIVLTIPAGSLLSDTTDPVAVGDLGQTFVSNEAARRLGCDAGVIEIVEDDQGTPLSVGRKRRVIAGSLKRALRQRDRGCSYPGCTHQVYLEGHHIRHWADGGETSLNNACLLCSHHHRFVHEYGYAVELGTDGRPRFRDPRGGLVTVVPARPITAAYGWSSITAANAPLAIDANTIACKWDGTPADYGAIVGYLLAADGLDKPATPAPGGRGEAWRVSPAA